MDAKLVRVAGLAFALLVMASCASSSGPRPLALGSDKDGTPTTFFAQYQGDGLSVFNTATGARLENLASWAATKQTFTGSSRTSDGDILFSLQRGPHYRSNVASGDPQPGSCGGRIERIDRRTGKTRTMLTIAVDRTVRSPTLSPDGMELAYATGPCTGYLDETLVIRDLATGQASNYRVPGARVGRVSWGPDHQIAFTALFRSARVGQVMSGYFITRDGRDLTFTRAQLQPSVPDCETQAVAYDTVGLVVLRGCPDVTGAAVLVQLDPHKRTVWTVAPPETPNGGTLSVAPNGHTILVGTYSPTAGDDVSIYNGTTLVTQHSYRYTVITSVTDAVW